MASTHRLYELSLFQDKARVLIQVGRIIGVISRALFRDGDFLFPPNKDRKESL